MSRNFKCKCCGAIRLVSATSKFIGVDKPKGTNYYRCRISTDGVQKFIGSFKSEAAAAQAYDIYVLENRIVGRALNFHNKNYKCIIA